MITFTLLLIALAVIAVMAFIGGSAVLLVFGDVIVCGLIIWGLYKLLKGKK